MFMENSIFADMEEIWNKVRNYENYEVSNLGGARSLDHWRDNGAGGYIQKGRILKPVKTKGYLYVGLCKDGKLKRFRVHRLVYEAFNGEIPEGMQVNHINEITTDNRLENLNLMSCKENINFGTAVKRRSEKRSQAVLQLTLDEVLVNEWPSMAEAGRHGFETSAISCCCRGIYKSYKGYIWRKKEC